MTIPSGATTWQSEPNSSPTSPTRSKTTPAKVTPASLGSTGKPPDTALIGEIAVWRAANGIDPQDPRPTGAAQLQNAADLWQQHLDRNVARVQRENIGHLDIPEPPSAPTPGDRRHQDRQRLLRPPAVRSELAAPPRPLQASPAKSRWRHRIHAGRKSRPRAAHPHYRIRLYQIRLRARLRGAGGRVSSLRCGHAASSHRRVDRVATAL